MSAILTWAPPNEIAGNGYASHGYSQGCSRAADLRCLDYMADAYHGFPQPGCDRAIRAQRWRSVTSAGVDQACACPARCLPAAKCLTQSILAAECKMRAVHQEQSLVLNL